MYYNTTNLSGSDLKSEIENAKTQKDAVLLIFQTYGPLTPSNAWSLYGATKAPLTSIRRAITDLTTEGHLIKSLTLKPGLYGKPEHLYKLLK